MKYYIEITEQHADELKRIGLGKDIIMMDDTERRHRPLLKAIEETTGVEQARIFEQDRTRYAVLARTIYVHYARVAGDGIEQIAKDLNRSRAAVNFYLRDFSSKIKYDIEFKRAILRVVERLEADTEWTPLKEQTHDVRKIRKKLLKKKKQQPKAARPRRRFVQLELFTN